MPSGSVRGSLVEHRRADRDRRRPTRRTGDSDRRSAPHQVADVAQQRPCCRRRRGGCRGRVSSSNSSTPCQDRAMPARARRSGLHVDTSMPSRSTRPDCWRVKPEMTSNSVVLPAPFGPMRPTTSPGDTRNETSSTAMTPPKRTDTPRTSSSRPVSARVRRGVGREPLPTACRRDARVKRVPMLAHRDATPSGARRRSWATPMALKMAIHAGDVVEVRQQVVRDRGSRWRPARRSQPRTTPEIHPRPPMTAYCTRRIDPKTSNEVNCTLRLAEREEDAAERCDAGADRERVELDADDADPERRRGALVAPDRDHPPAGCARPGGSPRRTTPRARRSASALRTVAGARTDRGRSRRSPGCCTRMPVEPAGHRSVLEDERAEDE